MCLSSCKDDSPKPASSLESVAIVYIVAEDNNLSASVADDLNELSMGRAGIPDDSRIVVYYDDMKKPAIYEISRKAGMVKQKQYEEDLSSADPETMLSIMQGIVRKYPARRYSLTIGAHGSAWLVHNMKKRSIAIDKNPSPETRLDIPDLRVILEQLPHMDFIFFDACFMQSIEVAYELRKTTDWIISSPAEIPGNGAPYNLLTEAMCKSDVAKIVNTYVNSYPTGLYPGVPLSAVKCCGTEIEDLAMATHDAVVKVLQKDGGKSLPGEIQKYSDSYMSYTFCYDMNSVMANLLSEEDYKDWMVCFEKAVPIREYTSTGRWLAGYCFTPVIYDPLHYGGISMYIPEDNYLSQKKTEDLKIFQWYSAAGWKEAGW